MAKRTSTNKCHCGRLSNIKQFNYESVTSQLISMLFLHVPTPFKFFGMTSGAVQKKKNTEEH